MAQTCVKRLCSSTALLVLLFICYASPNNGEKQPSRRGAIVEGIDIPFSVSYEMYPSPMMRDDEKSVFDMGDFVLHRSSRAPYIGETEGNKWSPSEIDRLYDEYKKSKVVQLKVAVVKNMNETVELFTSIPSRYLGHLHTSHGVLTLHLSSSDFPIALSYSKTPSDYLKLFVNDEMAVTVPVHAKGVQMRYTMQPTNEQIVTPEETKEETPPPKSPNRTKFFLILGLAMFIFNMYTLFNNATARSSSE